MILQLFKSRHFQISVIAVILFSSCRRESPSWDASVLIPLIKSTLTINHIISDSLLENSPNNTFDIVYKTGLYSFNTDTLFTIPDVSFDTLFVSPFQVTVNPMQDIVPFTQEENQSATGDVQLKQIRLRSGKMYIILRSQIQSMVDYKYKIVGATSKTGIPFDTTFRIPAATSTSDGILSVVMDLSGYTFLLTGKNGNKFNTITTEYRAFISPAPFGNACTINPGDSVVVKNKLSGIVPEYAKGYFGNTVETAMDTSTFYLFNHVLHGTLSLEQVNVDFSIENGVGADARIVIRELSSVNSRTGNIVALNHSVLNSPLNINRAVDNNGHVIPSVYKFGINTGNSNINDFIGNLPDKITYKMDFEINPLGNVSGSNDFIYYDKLMKTEMNMVIPLSLIANNLTLADTFDFSLGENTENLNHGTLYLYADNGFPFTAQAQLYVMNDNYQIIDSLISLPNIIASPLLDVNYICIGKKFSRLAIPIDASKMKLLRNTSKMYLKIKFNTAGQPSYVKIYSFYELNVKLIADFNYTIGEKN